MKKFRTPLRTMVPGEKGVGECPAEKDSILHGSVEVKAAELTVHQLDADVDLRANGRRIIAVAGNVACNGCKVGCKDAYVMLTQEEKKSPFGKIKRSGIDHVKPPNSSILLTIAERLHNRNKLDAQPSGIMWRLISSASKAGPFSTSPVTQTTGPEDLQLSPIYDDLIDLNSDGVLVADAEGNCRVEPNPNIGQEERPGQQTQPPEDGQKPGQEEA